MTASGFSVARVKPLFGRYILPEDENPGTPPVVVIAYEEWQRHFEGNRNVVGQQVQLGSVVRTVVGVMPDGFHFPVKHGYWVPMHLHNVPQQVGEGPEIYIFGRLADGATLETAGAELTTIGRRMAAAQPHTHRDLRPVIRPYTHAFTGIDTAAMIWLLRGVQLALSLLLIVVSVNVAILVYARTAARAGEITVRTALGASRARVITQLFVEALVLSGFAAVIGLLIASTALSMVVEFQARASDDSLPFWIDVTLSARTIVYSVGLALLAGGIVGVLPALKMTGRGMHDGLKQLSVRGAEIQLGRKWTALIIVQVAIAVAILPFALSVAGKSIRRGTARPGYAAHELLHTWLALEGEDPNIPENCWVACRKTSGLEAYRRAYEARFLSDGRELIRKLEAEPMVKGVTFASGLPGLEPYGRVQLEGTNDRRGVRANQVAVGYFNDIGVPLVAGRGFVASDTVGGARAVIVDRVFVDNALNGGNALGRRIRQVIRKPDTEPAEFDEGPWLEIVGVVPSFAVQPDFESADERIYLPTPWRYSVSAVLSVRVAGDGGPVAFAGRLREITTAVNPDFKLHELRTGTEAERQLREAVLSIAIMVVGVVGSVLLLSIAGIYAMMSFTVVRRRREIGIRVALGGDKWRVLRGIFARAGAQLGAGALAGLLFAGGVDRAVGQGPIFGGGLRIVPIVVLTVLAIGLLAAYGPARRGLAVQPTEALRQD
jgi:predicted permease